MIKVISILIRQFYMPNPFEPDPGAALFNWIAEPFIHLFTYFVVGLYYDAVSEPAIGSLLYLFFYFIHTGLLMAMGYFGWNTIVIILITLMYILVLCCISKLKDKF